MIIDIFLKVFCLGVVFFYVNECWCLIGILVILYMCNVLGLCNLEWI